MNPENLRIILSALQAVGAETKDAFIAYLIFGLVQPFAIAASICSVAYVLIKAIGKVVNQSDEDCRLVNLIGEELKNHNCGYAPSRRRMLEIVEELNKGAKK